MFVSINQVSYYSKRFQLGSVFLLEVPNMKKVILIMLSAVLVAACSHAPKKPGGKAFPINPTYQTGK